MLARQRPEKLLSVARSSLPKVLQAAAQRSPAYSILLEESGVNARDLAAAEGIEQAPILDKQSTFERFEIQEMLAKDVSVSDLGNVLTSSGYGATSFGFGLSDRKQHAEAPVAIDLGLQNAFAIDQRRTLLINTLPMGVVFESHAACVSNVSVREDMAFAIMRQAGPLFDQCILVVDPLFCKRFFDYAEVQGFDFSSQRIHMIIGEETFQEPFRDYLMGRLGISSFDGAEAAFVGSSMGVGELGLNLFFETPETIMLRRELHQLEPHRRQGMLFCYNPLRSWVEVHEPDEQGVGDLLITMMDKRATVPLPRYCTGDRVSYLGEEDLARVSEACRAAIQSLPFPVLIVHGRERDQLTAGWHVDDFKALQYRSPTLARQLSGAFRIEAESGVLRWHLQAAKDASESRATLESHLRELYEQQCLLVDADPEALSELKVFATEKFPYGMSLDYERKFRYPGAAV